MAAATLAAFRKSSNARQTKAIDVDLYYVITLKNSLLTQGHPAVVAFCRKRDAEATKGADLGIDFRTNTIIGPNVRTT